MRKILLGILALSIYTNATLTEETQQNLDSAISRFTKTKNSTYCTKLMTISLTQEKARAIIDTESRDEKLNPYLMAISSLPPEAVVSITLVYLNQSNQLAKADFEAWKKNESTLKLAFLAYFELTQLCQPESKTMLDLLKDLMTKHGKHNEISGALLTIQSKQKTEMELIEELSTQLMAAYSASETEYIESTGSQYRHRRQKQEYPINTFCSVSAVVSTLLVISIALNNYLLPLLFDTETGTGQNF